MSRKFKFKFTFEGFLISVMEDWVTVPTNLMEKLRNDPRFVDLWDDCNYFVNRPSASPLWGDRNHDGRYFTFDLSIDRMSPERKPRVSFLARLQEEYK